MVETEPGFTPCCVVMFEDGKEGSFVAVVVMSTIVVDGSFVVVVSIVVVVTA